MMNSLTQSVSLFPGVNYEYLYVPPATNDSSTILFLHGFPSSVHSWRHQISYFREKGYGCLAPNMMGYGRTYSPADFQEYKAKQMVIHLVALLAHLSIDKPVIVVGHDFGTLPASRLALYEPDRVRGLILLNIGFSAPGDQLDLDRLVEGTKASIGYDVFGYWKFFGRDPDAAQLIESNPMSFLDLAFPSASQALDLWKTHLAPTGKLKEWLLNGTRFHERANYITDTDYYVYIGYLLEGMNSKLNWYRAQINNVNYEDEQSLDRNLRVPLLFLGALRDAIAQPRMFASQKQYANDLTEIDIDSAHWMMEEKFEQVNDEIEKWINNKF